MVPSRTGLLHKLTASTVRILSPNWPAAVAGALDEVCARAERKMRDVSEHDLRMEEANDDVDQRMLGVDHERLRSREFEVRRLGVCRAPGIRVKPAPGSRSARSRSPTGSGRRVDRTVPNFRHVSPATVEILKGEQGIVGLLVFV